MNLLVELLHYKLCLVHDCNYEDVGYLWQLTSVQNSNRRTGATNCRSQSS